MSLKWMLQRCLGGMLLFLSTVSASVAGGGGPCGTGSPHSAPEPATLALLGVGVVGVVVARKHLGKRRK